MFGGKPARALPTPPPHPTAQVRTFDTWKMCECDVRMRFPFAGLGRGEWGGGGGGERETMPFVNGSTHQLQTQNQDSQYYSPSFLFGEMCLSPSGVLCQASAFLYSGAEPIKGRPSWQPALSRLHYILQSTPL